MVCEETNQVEPRFRPSASCYAAQEHASGAKSFEFRIDRLLETIRLTPFRDRIAGGLSHGQKQWLEIGMLLMQEPELLLVDEPVAGMTPQEIERTAGLLQSLAGEHSIVVVEHDMEFVRSIARRVTVLHEGRVLAEGDIAG